MSLHWKFNSFFSLVCVTQGRLSINYFVIKLFFDSDRTFRLAHTFFVTDLVWVFLFCFVFFFWFRMWLILTSFGSLPCVVFSSKRGHGCIVNICIFIHLAAEFNMCERSIFCHHFCRRINKTVHENLVAVKLIIVLWGRNPTLWLQTCLFPNFLFFFLLLYNSTLKPWVVSLYCPF